MTSSTASRVVVVAFAVSASSAAAKLTASAFTGSSAMLVAAIHSLADASSQGLMLFGLNRMSRRPEHEPPAVVGNDLYFWTHVVALLLFSASAGVAIHEGVGAVLDPRSIADPHVAIATLTAAFFASVAALWRATGTFAVDAPADASSTAEPVSPVHAVTLTVIAQQVAALVGSVLAMAGIAAVHLLGWSWADGAASIAIGLLLASVAAFMALELRRIVTRASSTSAMPVSSSGDGDSWSEAASSIEPSAAESHVSAPSADPPEHAADVATLSALPLPPPTRGDPPGKQKRKNRRRGR